MPITAAGKKNRAAEAATGPARAPNCAADRDDSTPGAASGIRNTSPPATTKSPAKTCGERGEKHADQAPPHIDGVAEDGRDDPAGDNLQRQQHCAAYKDGDFKDRSLPVSLPGLPGLHTYNLWGSVLQNEYVLA